MIAKITHKGKIYQADLDKPIDISIPLRSGADNVNAWYVNPITIEPVRMGDWVGDVNQGGSVNFRNICFNPHGNGTHTECVGHISKETYSVNRVLKKFFFIAAVITVQPDETVEADFIITKNHIREGLKGQTPEALVIRTLDNPVSKMNRQYSNTNPAYLTEEAALFIHELGIDHLLIDLPSVDKEVDQGRLLAHRAFWQYPHNTQSWRTITELIYVPDPVQDGLYLLNLQTAGFENDASPVRPVLYELYPDL